MVGRLEAHWLVGSKRERLHNAEKRIITKTRARLSPEVKDTLTCVKMSAIRKRSERVNLAKTYKRTDRVTALGLVCEKMAKRVADVRKEKEDRQAAHSLARMSDAVMVEEEGVATEEGAEAEIWSVTDITEEELVEEEGAVTYLCLPFSVCALYTTYRLYLKPGGAMYRLLFQMT